MNPKYAPPCPHRCCTEPEDGPPHEHDVNAVDCEACDALADVHPLASRALRIGARKHEKLIDEKENNDG